MLRKGELFAGLTVAIVTPFKSDDSVDYDKLKELVEWHIQQGTDCLAPMGTTGESPTLTTMSTRRSSSAWLRPARAKSRSWVALARTVLRKPLN